MTWWEMMGSRMFTFGGDPRIPLLGSAAHPAGSVGDSKSSCRLPVEGTPNGHSPWRALGEVRKEKGVTPTSISPDRGARKGCQMPPPQVNQSPGAGK